MDQRAAFMEAVLATPADDAPRLVFADWLDDHGDEHDRGRAAFIRVQCEAAKLTPDDPRLVELRRREDELLRDHGAWFSPLLRLRDEWRHARGHELMGYPYRGELPWHRGFPRWLDVSAPKFPREIENLLKYEAVFDVTLDFHDLGMHGPGSDPAWLGPLVESPRLSLVGLIDLCDTNLCGDDPPAHFLRLVRAPGLTGLKHLSVAMDSIGLAGVRGLLESPTPFLLRSLMLSCFIEPAFAEAGRAEDFLESVRLLAQSPRLSSLEALFLDSRYDAEGRGEEAARLLLASPHLPHGMELRFGALRELADTTRAALGQRFRLAVE